MPEEGARVDHYGDGAWYDAEYVHIRADIPLYRQIAKAARGPILELACGTGRLSFPMAEAGARVVGVDAALPMLERARARTREVSLLVGARLEWVEGDMRSIRLGRRSDRVILGFNPLLHMLEDADLEATLVTAREHLAPGGRFHLDLFTPPEMGAPRDPEGRFDPQQMFDPVTRQRWIVTENNRYDPRTQINHMRFYYRRADAEGQPVGPERVAEIPLRVIYPRELDSWLARTGLRVVAEHEDFERSRPYTAQAGLRVLELEAF